MEKEWQSDTKYKILGVQEKASKKASGLICQFIIIDTVVSTNVIKLQLPTSMRIHLALNVSWVVKYREQKAEEVKPVEVDGVEE